MPYPQNRETLHCPSDSLDNGRRAVPFWFPRSWVNDNFWIRQGRACFEYPLVEIGCGRWQ